MTKTTTLLIAAAMIALSLAFLPRALTRASNLPHLSETPTCGDQYNAMVLRAKQALARGDRAAAISGLIEAQGQLRHCQELEERNAQAPHGVALEVSRSITLASR